MPIRSVGFDAYKRRLRGLRGRRRHELVITNAMEYAVYLQARDGYYVFNDGELLRIALKWFRKLEASNQTATTRNIERALEAAAREYIDFLRSATSTMRPPVRARELPRFATPGGWANRTGNLSAAFQALVNGDRI